MTDLEPKAPSGSNPESTDEPENIECTEPHLNGKRFNCFCGASHERGPVDGIDTYRCLKCGETWKIKPNKETLQQALHNAQPEDPNAPPGAGITKPSDAEIEGLMHRAAKTLVTSSHSADPNSADPDALNIDVQIEKAKAEGNAVLLANLKRLKGKGIDKNTRLTLGSSYEGPEQRWWQCPHCLTYIDAMVSVDGGPERMVFEDILCCPGFIKDPKDPKGKRMLPCKTPGSEFNTVEGEFFDETLPKLKGIVKAGLDRAIIQTVRAASAGISELGLFNADPQFDKIVEPRWPREMAAVILGCTAYFGKIMDKLSAAISKPPNKKGKNSKKHHRRRPKNHPPTEGEGHGFGHEESDDDTGHVL